MDKTCHAIKMTTHLLDRTRRWNPFCCHIVSLTKLTLLQHWSGVLLHPNATRLNTTSTVFVSGHEQLWHMMLSDYISVTAFTSSLLHVSPRAISPILNCRLDPSADDFALSLVYNLVRFVFTAQTASTGVHSEVSLLSGGSELEWVFAPAQSDQTIGENTPGVGLLSQISTHTRPSLPVVEINAHVSIRTPACLRLLGVLHDLVSNVSHWWGRLAWKDGVWVCVCTYLHVCVYCFHTQTEAASRLSSSFSDRLWLWSAILW